MNVPGFLFFFFMLQQKSSADVEAEWEKRYRLPGFVRPVHYELFLNLKTRPPFYRTKQFGGVASILFQTNLSHNMEQSIILNTRNLRIVHVTLRNAKTRQELHIRLRVTQEEFERTIFTVASPIEQHVTYQFEITYVGVLQTGKQGFYLSKYMQDNEVEWLAVVNSLPIHARSVFPCFDEPQFKATFKLRVRHPSRLKCTSNTKVIRRQLDNTTTMATTEFDQTKPLSPHNLALVVSSLEEHSVSLPNKVEHNFWFQTDLRDREQFALNMAPRAFDVMIDLFGDLYQLVNLTRIQHVAIPDGSAGSTDWGMIVYREMWILWGKQQSTVDYQEGVALRLHYALALTWFGNVRMSEWWNDIWMNEGFAVFFCYYVLEQLENWNVMKQMVDKLQIAMEMNSYPNTRPLSQIPSDVATPIQIDGLIDDNYKREAAALVRMMYNFMGHDTFMAGIKTYLSEDFKPYFTTVAPDDLWNAWTPQQLSKILPPKQSLKVVMSSWTENAGFPVVKVTLKIDRTIIEAERFLYSPVNDSKIENEMYIPITYTTQKDTDFTATTVKSANWIIKNTELTVEDDLSASSTWIVVNLQAAFYYRVNYCHTLWERLRKALNRDHTQIHVLNRAQIISDVINFARVDLITYDRAFDILFYLKHETEYIPWKVAFRELHILRRRFFDINVRKPLDNFIKMLLQKIFKNVMRDHYRPVELINHQDILRNRMIMTWACKIGFKECVEYSKKRFSEFIQDNKRVEPNQRNYVYCSGIFYLDSESDWITLYTRMNETKQPSEVYLLIQALGCSPRKETLMWYLEQALHPNSTISRYNCHRIFLSVIRNTQDGIDIGLNFFIKNFDLIRAHYNSKWDVIDAVNQLGNLLATRAQVDKFQKFAQEPTLGQLQHTVDRAIAKSEYNLAWVQKTRTELMLALSRRLKKFRSNSFRFRVTAACFVVYIVHYL